MFHSEKEVHLDLVLGTDEFGIVDGVSEAVESFERDVEEVLGVGAGTGDFDTEEA